MLKLYIPAPDELDFRQKLYADPETMTYNRGYDSFPGYDPVSGVIDFSRGRWEAWSEKWLGREPERFYAYLQREDGTFVGDVCFYVTGTEGERMIGIVIHSAYRGMGYSEEGLRLLIERAFSHKEVCSLRNEFETHRKAAMHVHQKVGFTAEMTGGKAVLTLKK